MVDVSVPAVETDFGGLIYTDERSGVMLVGDERVVWTERAAMRDLYLNPLFMLLVVVLSVAVFGLGILIFVVAMLRRYYTRYTLTTHRLIVTSGILSKRVDEVELYRVRDSRSTQSFWERICGMGSISVASTDGTGVLRISKVVQPREKREQIRALTEINKRHRNVRIVE